MRAFVGTLLAVAIALIGVVGLIAFLNSRDESTTGSDRPAPAPGVEKRAPRGSLLAQGNVVLRYSDGSFTRALEKLARDLGAPDSPESRAAGQAVILRPDPDSNGIVARAAARSLIVARPSDPQLQAFVERWLGQGASG